jgi:hypothetical protein
VKQSDLDEYEENVREKQNIQVHAKALTPPQTKANQIKRQTQQKTSTPPEVENIRFHQLSLDTPQDKHRPLNQQRKSKHI